MHVLAHILLRISKEIFGVWGLCSLYISSSLQLKVLEQEVRWVNGLEWIWTVMTIGAPVVLKIVSSPLQKQCNGFPKFEHRESEILKGGVVHFATESIFRGMCDPTIFPTTIISIIYYVLRDLLIFSDGILVFKI